MSPLFFWLFLYYSYYKSTFRNDPLPAACDLIHFLQKIEVPSAVSILPLCALTHSLSLLSFFFECSSVSHSYPLNLLPLGLVLVRSHMPPLHHQSFSLLIPPLLTKALKSFPVFKVREGGRRMQKRETEYVTASLE